MANVHNHLRDVSRSRGFNKYGVLLFGSGIEEVAGDREGILSCVTWAVWLSNRHLVAVGTPIARRPPHRSVRARLTHTALTVDAWRQKRKSNCSPHTAQSLGHALPRSVSGTCKIERCSPQSAPFPPQPPQKVTLRCSAGSRVLRHSPTSPERSCPPFGLWPSRTGLRLSTKASRRSPGSRACCFSACAGSSTTQDRSIHSH